MIFSSLLGIVDVSQMGVSRVTPALPLSLSIYLLGQSRFSSHFHRGEEVLVQIWVNLVKTHSSKFWVMKACGESIFNEFWALKLFGESTFKEFWENKAWLVRVSYRVIKSFNWVVMTLASLCAFLSIKESHGSQPFPQFAANCNLTYLPRRGIQCLKWKPLAKSTFNKLRGKRNLWVSFIRW